MATNIRFDYYQLTVDKQRRRSTEQGQQYFGRLSAINICQWVNDYYQSNLTDFGDHGLHLLDFHNGKKWIKWVRSEFTNNKLKLLFTFNDKQIDPRYLADNQDNVLAQPIPNEHFGQRSLLHIVINADTGIICVQNIAGFTKPFLERLVRHLIERVTDQNFWQATDSMTQEPINCKPAVEITNVTTDEILQTVQHGGLRGLTITKNEYDIGSFDQTNHLTSKKTKIIIRADGNSFINTTRDTLLQWANLVAREKSDLDDPTVSLLVKDPQTGSEVEHEIINNLIDGFGKKTYLNWEDRDDETHNNIANELPLPITQFFNLMIERF